MLYAFPQTAEMSINQIPDVWLLSQLCNSLSLNLADTFSGNLILISQLLKSILLAFSEAQTLLEDVALLRCELAECFSQLVSNLYVIVGILWLLNLEVLQHLAEGCLIIIIDLTIGGLD